MALTGEAGRSGGLERPGSSPRSTARGGPVSLGAELRRLRKGRGLSQRALAQRLGYSAHSAIADYETGRRVPANDVLVGYERLFQLPAGLLQKRRTAVLSELADEQFTFGVTGAEATAGLASGAVATIAAIGAAIAGIIPAAGEAVVAVEYTVELVIQSGTAEGFATVGIKGSFSVADGMILADTGKTRSVTSTG